LKDDWVGWAKSARGGDEEAFSMLVKRFVRPVCATIYPIVRDWHLTQDVAQETFVCAYERLSDLRTAKRFRSWLFQIARNRAVSRIRTGAQLKPRSLSTVDENEVIGILRASRCALLDGSRPAGPRGDLLSRVRRVICALPNGYGSLLVMRYAEGLAIEEIAEICGRSPKGVKAVLYRARQLARSELDRAGLDVERVLHEM
jgi:RNA polymerase sigma-70 factor (ECF subfamily)